MFSHRPAGYTLLLVICCGCTHLYAEENTHYKCSNGREIYYQAVPCEGGQKIYRQMPKEKSSKAKAAVKTKATAKTKEKGGEKAQAAKPQEDSKVLQTQTLEKPAEVDKTKQKTPAKSNFRPAQSVADKHKKRKKSKVYSDRVDYVEKYYERKQKRLKRDTKR